MSLISTIILIAGIVCIAVSFFDFHREEEHELSKDFVTSKSFIVGVVLTVVAVLIKIAGILI